MERYFFFIVEEANEQARRLMVGDRRRPQTPVTSRVASCKCIAGLQESNRFIHVLRVPSSHRLGHFQSANVRGKKLLRIAQFPGTKIINSIKNYLTLNVKLGC